jgi:hypothetical protein
MDYSGHCDPETAETLLDMLGAVGAPQSPTPNVPDPRTKPERYGDGFGDVVHLAAKSPDLPDLAPVRRTHRVWGQ